jgi:hypothetical protein
MRNKCGMVPYLLDDQPFDLTLIQLKMVDNNIMDEVRRKYELSPMLNAPNLRRERCSEGC